MSKIRNTLNYNTTEKDFYKHVDNKKISPNFKEHLKEALETFKCDQTQRSKKIFQGKRKSKAIWDIHLPNPGIRGKNAFRMLCIIDTDKKEIILAHLFPRETLKYKKEKNRKGTEDWNNCVEELKQKYFQ